METINSSNIGGTRSFSHPLKVNAFHIENFDKFYY